MNYALRNIFFLNLTADENYALRSFIPPELYCCKK
jgi:hypothetical protein